MGGVDDGTGRLLNHRYRLGEVLGRGGMGTVWRARDEVLGRTVAVKELRFPSGIDEDEKRRLITRTLREAKAIARIRSGGAITVYDVVDEDDRPWIVMELVEGRSLAEFIRDEGPLTPRRAAEVGLAVLAVLRDAHREGILHRDVKPSNVLIAEEDGRVVLTDFGIAKVEGDPSITSTGMLVGAPSYISPERARGQRPGPPADLWSLGVLLYAAVEGRAPYDRGSALSTLTAVMTEPMDPPVRAGALAEVIYGLLAKDPEKRLDEVGARVLLEGVASAPETPAEPSPGTERTAVLVADSARESTAGSVGTSGVGSAQAEPTPPRTPAPAAPPSTRVSRRTVLVGVTLAVVLAVLGSVLALVLVNADQESDGGAAPASRGSSNESSVDHKGENASTSSAAEAPTASDGSHSPQPGHSGPTKASLPPGYHMWQGMDFHFQMALPEGWKRTGTAGQNSGGIYSAPGGGYPKVQVDFTDSPGSDAVAAWERLERVVKDNSSGYRRISLDEVTWRAYPTVADWVFERMEHGTKVRVKNRGFAVDDKRGYAIMITCEAKKWNGEQCRTLRETAYRTFRPR